MPLIGIIDPSHAERANNEPGRYPNWLPIDQLLTKAEAADPKWSPWTFELLNAAMQEHQERDYLSTTAIISPCPRGAVLERREDYIADPARFFAALRGTMVHRTLEQAARESGVAEARFFTNLYVPKLGDIEVSCSPDLVSFFPVTLWDYKVTENPPSFGYPWKSHTLQLQFNRYIVNHAERWDAAITGDTDHPSRWRFEHLAIVYIGPKEPKVIECMATKEVLTPNQKTIKRKFPDIWSDEKVEAEMLPRLEAMVRALEAYPEWPDGLEDYPGWAGPPGWGCPGVPLCYLPHCLAKRYPDRLTWSQKEAAHA